MSWRNRLLDILLIYNLSLLIYFGSSFPIRMNIYPNPELGPFFEGDILTNPYGRNGIPNEIYRWEKGIFKFHVQDDYSFKEMETIYIAILEIVSNTCITVNELLTSSMFGDHAYYTPDYQTCASDVGRRSWRQYINLASLCLMYGHGIAVHETLHAIGFYHEHSREDRDEYISINIDNVYPSERFQFNIFPSETYGVPYDYGSIMHYPEDAFAIDPTVKVITVKQPGAQIGNRAGMSPSDIKKVNIMYKKECDSRLAPEALEVYLSQREG